MQRLLAVLVISVVSGSVAAQTPPATPPATAVISSSIGAIVYPAKGQTPAKQAADEQECYAWAKAQTNVDPLAAPAPAQAANPPPADPQAAKADGSRLRGAARGAAAGAVIGEIANDDAGKGAAIGATAGVVAGGARSRRAQEEQKQQASQQAQQQTASAQAAEAEKLANFKKAFGVCLQARGYTTG